MSQVLVSSKYQVVIPKDIRRQFKIKPGQRLSFIATGATIRLVPSRSLSSLRGFIPKVDLADLRDKKNRIL